jgi:hypothetical protein
MDLVGEVAGRLCDAGGVQQRRHTGSSAFAGLWANM